MSFVFAENQQLVLYTSASLLDPSGIFHPSDTELEERSREVLHKDKPLMLYLKDEKPG